MLVLTGTGRAFSTDANLQGRGKDGITRGAGQALETVFHPFHASTARSALPDPAVNGPAAGAGLDLECLMQCRAGASNDFREGVTAFLEKRPAKFIGK